VWKFIQSYVLLHKKNTKNNPGTRYEKVKTAFTFPDGSEDIEAFELFSELLRLKLGQFFRDSYQWDTKGNGAARDIGVSDGTSFESSNINKM
jgi:hypothetical protein